MTDTPLPPPMPPNSNPPPMPPSAYPAPPAAYPAPPAAYPAPPAAYPIGPAGAPSGLGGPVERVSGLGNAVRILFWVSTGLMGLVLIAALNRRSVWDGYRNGSKSFNDIDSADQAIGGALILAILAQLAAVIVLCVWSIKATRNGNRLWRSTASPGLAGGGWWIPFGWFVVPFIQLRRVFTAGRLRVDNLNLWQGTFILGAVVNAIGRAVGNLDVDSARDLSGRLTAQVVWFTVSFVATAFSAFFGGRAIMELSRSEESVAG